MPLVLAIEPDPRQASRLEHLMRTRVGAELIRADTTEHALAAIGTRVPDLVLVPSLLSPQEDAAIAGALRVIAAAARVQMLTIPLLADPEQPPDVRRGLLGRWRRGAARQITGCDPAIFAEQVAAYLAHARSDRLQGDEAVEQEALAARGAAQAPDAMGGDEPARRDAPGADVAAAAPEGLDGPALTVPVTAVAPPTERAPQRSRARQHSVGRPRRPSNGATLTSNTPHDEPIVSIEPRRLVAPAAFVKHVRETEIHTTPEGHGIDRAEARSGAERAVVSSAVEVLASSREQSEKARDERQAVAGIDDIAPGARGEHTAAERVEAAPANLFGCPARDDHEAQLERTEGELGPTVDVHGLAHQVPASEPGGREPLPVSHDAELQGAAAGADRTGTLEGMDAPSAPASSDVGEAASPHAEAVDLGLLVRGADEDTGAMGTIEPAAQTAPGERAKPEHLAAADLLLCAGREDQEGLHEESDESQRGPAAALASHAGEMGHAPMLPDIESTAAGREHLLAHDSDLRGDAAPPHRALCDEGAEGRAAQASNAEGTRASLQGEHVDVDVGPTSLVVRADRDGRDAGEMPHEEIGGALARQISSGGERQERAGLPPRAGSAGDEIDASTVDALIAPLLRELMASRLARTEARATERPARGPASGDRREQQVARRPDSEHDAAATRHVASEDAPTHARAQAQSRDHEQEQRAAHEHVQAHPHAHERAPTHAHLNPAEHVHADVHERGQVQAREPSPPPPDPRAEEHEGAGLPAQASASADTELPHDPVTPAAERPHARAEGEHGDSARSGPVRDGRHESAPQEHGRGREARPLVAGRASEQSDRQTRQLQHLHADDVANVQALSPAPSAVASPEEIDPMFFVDDDSPDAGPPTSAAASVHVPAPTLPALEAADAPAASPGRSAAGAPAAAREPWVELIESLRQDIERLRLEREAAGGPQADRTRPTSRVVTSFDEAKSRVRPRITAPQLRMPDPPRSSARPTRKRPVQDQWGLFDPEQCGFAALLAKLDEISARDEASA